MDAYESDIRRRAQHRMWILVGTTIAVTAFAAAVAIWMYWLAGLMSASPAS